MLEDLFHLFFPNYCYKCGNILHKQQKYFCYTCDQQIPRFDNSISLNNLFHDRLFNKIDLFQGFSYFSYQKESPVQELMHDLKYSGLRAIGVFYGHRLAKAMQSYLIQKPDLVVPVPLHNTKLRKRGYNQAQVIAQVVSDVLEVPMLIEGVSKNRTSSSQTKLNRLDRWVNVKDIFLVEGDLNGKHLLLVDDVFTTGSTMESFAKACMRAHCNKISIATLGIAI